MKNTCIFCKTQSNEFNSNRLVFQDDNVVIFLSNQPTKPGHVLVIPKDHYETIWDTPDEILQRLILYVKKLAFVVKEVTNADGINIGVNNGEAAGQKINHVHFHIIPRYINDGLELMPSGDISDEDLTKYTELIRQYF